MSRLAQSRAKWKEKAIIRGKENREHRRSDQIKDAKIISLENRLHEALEKIAGLNNGLQKLLASKNPPTRIDSIIVCIHLIIFARISFRSVPRVLQSINWQGWIPSFSSAINWLCRLGLQKMRTASKLLGPWIAIIDMTLDIAFKKALVVLRVPLKVFFDKRDALSLSDVSCVGMAIRKEWNGDSVSQSLLDILGDDESLKAIIKDSGSDLTKGVNLWRDGRRAGHVYVISDLGHEVANALKADFNEKLKFSEITGTIKSGASKLYQSNLSFLAPPKIRTKGRFMSISRLARWFDKMRDVLGGPGRAKKGSFVEQVRTLFGGLGPLHYDLDQLSERSLKLAEVMEILKNKGLNQETYRESMNIVETLPPRTQARKRLRRWLRTHLAVQARLSIGQTPLPISSDIIESLFGSFKGFIARNSKAELNHLALCIPALCGPTTDSEIYASQQTISQKDIQTWVENNIGVTSLSRRRKFLKGELDGDSMQIPGDTMSA